MQAWRNPHLVSYAQAAAAFATREQTPRDFLERCIAAIEAHESRIQAFVSLDLKMARAAADAGLHVEQLGPVDLGGFTADLQRFTR